MDELRSVLVRVEELQADLELRLGRFESSSAGARVLELDDTRQTLLGMGIEQQELFDQALKCIEGRLYRASHVMAWAAFMGCLHERLHMDNFSAMHGARPKWRGEKTVEDLQNSRAEFQVLEVARDVGLLSKTACKRLHGRLADRNECAHPGGSDPDMNESIGYVATLLKQLGILLKKAPQYP